MHYISPFAWIMFLIAPSAVYILALGAASALGLLTDETYEYASPHDEARENALWRASSEWNRLMTYWLWWGLLPAGGFAAAVVVGLISIAVPPLAAAQFAIAAVVQWSVPPLMRFVLGPYVLHVYRWRKVNTFLAIYSLAVLVVLATVGGFMGWIGVSVGLIGRVLPHIAGYIVLAFIVAVVVGGIIRFGVSAMRSHRTNMAQLDHDLATIEEMEALDPDGVVMDAVLQTEAER